MKLRSLALRQSEQKWPANSYRSKRQLRAIFTVLISPSSSRLVQNSCAQDAFNAFMITAT